MSTPRKDAYTMTEALRKQLDGAESLAAIERATGIHRASMRRFRDGQTSLRLDVADRLAEFFGVTIQTPKRRKGDK